MSRHTIEARDPERFTVAVGYDAALATYFGQVIDRRIERDEEERAARIAAGEQDDDEDETPERDAVVLWIGTTVGEVPTVAELARLIETYAVLTFEFARTLQEDQRGGAHPPTPLQRKMRGLIRGR